MRHVIQTINIGWEEVNVFKGAANGDAADDDDDDAADAREVGGGGGGLGVMPSSMTRYYRFKRQRFSHIPPFALRIKSSNYCIALIALIRSNGEGVGNRGWVARIIKHL